MKYRTQIQKTAAQQNAPLVDKIELCAPVAGTVKALSDVPDKTFADKVLGDGAAIVPSEGKGLCTGRWYGGKYHGQQTWNHVCDRKWSRNSDPHRT